MAEAVPARPPPDLTSGGGEAGGRTHRFTSLENCRIEREEHEEMPFVETRCEGLGGYDLKVTESDARNNLIVVAPGGAETSLELSRIGGGGFSGVGKTAEWRGTVEGERFEPDAFVVRFEVAEEPYPAPETSYLLAVRLAPTPCVVGKIAPGPRQNERARVLADGRASCLVE